ncbi:hypothetical protein ACJX0J_006315, partial [Zea mays]
LHRYFIYVNKVNNKVYLYFFLGILYFLVFVLYSNVSTQVGRRPKTKNNVVMEANFFVSVVPNKAIFLRCHKKLDVHAKRRLNFGSLKIEACAGDAYAKILFGYDEWINMIDRFDLHVNKWFGEFYDDRHLWALAYQYDNKTCQFHTTYTNAK